MQAPIARTGPTASPVTTGPPAHGGGHLTRAEAERLFAERKRAIELDARARRFFLRLDRATSQPLEPVLYSTCIGPLFQSLWRRACLRASCARRSGPGRSPGVPDLTRIAPPPAQLRRVASIFLDAADELGRDSSDPAADLCWAFEQFASGRLATHHPEAEFDRLLETHGVPDGVAYLLFAEFALACLATSPPIEPCFTARLLLATAPTALLIAAHPLPPRGRRGQWDHRESPLPMAALTRLRTAIASHLPMAGDNRRLFLEDLTTYAAGVLIDGSLSTLQHTGRPLRHLILPHELHVAHLRGGPTIQQDIAETGSVQHDRIALRTDRPKLEGEFR